MRLRAFARPGVRVSLRLVTATQRFLQLPKRAMRLAHAYHDPNQRFLMARRLWARAELFRPLLQESPRNLSLRHRLERQLTKRFLSLPDRYYRRVFRRLDLRIGSQTASNASRRGVILMIGQLGPGGTERQLVNTALALKARYPRGPRVVCTDLSAAASRFFLPELEEAGIPVSDLTSSPRTAFQDKLGEVLASLPLGLQPVSAYASPLAIYRPAVAHLWLDEVNVLGGIAAVLTGVPKIVLSLRAFPPFNFAFHKPEMHEAYRWLIRQPNVTVVSNSRAGAASYEKWIGLAPASIPVLPNGFQFDDAERAREKFRRESWRCRMGIPPNAPVVGGVFRLTEEKRPLLWLEIAARTRQLIPDVRFLLLGDGPLRERMLVRAQQSDLRGAVSFAGHDKDALGAMAAMDLLLLASRAEGLPNVLIEAQSVGVPVVATAVGGAPETLLEGRTGWLLRDTDCGRAAELIAGLLRDRALRQRASSEAMAFVRRAFGIERAVEATLALYGDAVERCGGENGCGDGTEIRVR